MVIVATCFPAKSMDVFCKLNGRAIAGPITKLSVGCLVVEHSIKVFHKNTPNCLHDSHRHSICKRCRQGIRL